MFLAVKVCCWVWFVKLGLQETHRLCGPEEPRCHMLHELPSTDTLLHKQTETGESLIFLMLFGGLLIAFLSDIFFLRENSIHIEWTKTDGVQ